MFKAPSQTPSFLPYLLLYPTSSSTYLFETFLVSVLCEEILLQHISCFLFQLTTSFSTSTGKPGRVDNVLNELPFMGHLSSRSNTLTLPLNRPFALPRLSTLRPVVISWSLLSVGSLLRPTVQGRINRLLPIKCSFVFYCIYAFSLPCQCLLPSTP